MWVLVLGSLAAVVAAYWGSAFLLERRILFPAPDRAGAVSPRPDAQVIQLRTGQGSLRLLFLKPFGTAATAAAPLILFMHGNGEIADDWANRFDAARRIGFSVLLAEYPGYNGCDGDPTEESIGEAVRAAYDWAARDPRVDGHAIVAYGRSLGGAAAIELAVTRPVSALVVQSTFTSVASIAHRFLLPGFLVRDQFDSLSKLKAFHGELLVIHGDRDRTIPFEHAAELARAVARAELIALGCGHNDCGDTWPAVGEFLSRRARLPR